MNCPHCGNQMDPDKVFCENCGKERNLVPLYEPEVELKVEQSIHNIINEFHGDAEQSADSSDIDNNTKLNIEESSTSKENANNDSSDAIQRKKHLKKQMIFFLLGIFVLLIGIIIFILIFSKSTNDSFEYHYQRARQSYDMHDYENALKEANYCLDLNPNSVEVYEIKFHIFQEEDQWESCLEMANRLYELGEDSEDISEALVKDLINSDNYAQVATFLELCPYEDLKTAYVDYLVFEPTFSEKEGEYEDFLSLAIESDGTGDIYYNLEGQTPTNKDEKYTSPIQLQPGSYDICAIYVNQFGVAGEVVKAHYEITGDLNFDSVIYPEEGNYKNPEFIYIDLSDANYNVYYTTNGSDPDENSTLYTEPIPMPIGHSVFKFVSIDEKGRKSEVVTYTYDSNPDTIYTLEQSDIILKQNLITRGEMANVNGDMLGQDVRKFILCNSAISVKNEVYYFYYEYVGKDEQNIEPTGNIYAFHVINGEIFRATINEKGEVTLSAF